MKFIISILVIFTSALIFIGSFYITEQYIKNELKGNDIDMPEVEVADENIKIFNDSGLRFSLINLSPEVVYSPTQTNTVRQIAIENKYSLVINGGFFNSENKYAGALIINNEVISNPAPLDTQLSHVVTFDRKSNKYEFIRTTKFISSAQYDLAFQSGPLFIEKNIIQQDFINNSVNGSGEYQRSFLGITTEGEVIVGVTLDKFTLSELAEILLSHETLKNKEITVINLDGGSSSALYLGESSPLNYGQYKTLPVLIGFK